MNGRSNLSLASCSSLMTDCHMTRRRKNRKERQGRKGEWERKKGRKINFVTYDLLNKSLTKYSLVEYCDTYTCVHVHVMYIYIIKTCNISSLILSIEVHVNPRVSANY